MGLRLLVCFQAWGFAVLELVLIAASFAIGIAVTFTAGAQKQPSILGVASTSIATVLGLLKGSGQPSRGFFLRAEIQKYIYRCDTAVICTYQLFTDGKRLWRTSKLAGE